MNSLAARALSMLSAKGSAISPDYSSPQLQAICDAYVDHKDSARHEAIASLRSHGLSSDDIIQHIIPATANLLGERWGANKISFADVTIGTARLQETVRSLCSHSARTRPLNGDCILLVVPRSEYHTLGVFVAAHQFRKLGIEVHLAVGQHPRQIASLVMKHRFPAVGITASGRRSLASARDMVEIIRGYVPRVVPIVIGGSVTSLDLDIKSITGADYVSSDPARMIALCKLEASAILEHADV